MEFVTFLWKRFRVMKKLLCLTASLLLLIINGNSQEEKLEIEGAIQVGNSEDPTPWSRYNKMELRLQDFEGCYLVLGRLDRHWWLGNKTAVIMTYRTASQQLWNSLPSRDTRHETLAENLSNISRYNDAHYPIPLSVIYLTLQWAMITGTPACAWYEDTCIPFGIMGHCTPLLLCWYARHQ